MDIQIISHSGTQIAEITGPTKGLKGPQDVHDLIGTLAFEHKVTRVLADRSLVDESFFDLRSGFAGELSQKFTNYRMKLAILGDFSWIENIALKAFVYESNLGNTLRFIKDRNQALAWLAKD